MLEILLLIFMCRNIGQIVRRNGVNATGYQFTLVGLWFGGEILGGIIGFGIASVGNVGPDSFGFVAYACALIGAAIGAFVAFRIAKGTRPAPVGHAFPVVMPGTGAAPPPENRTGEL